MKFYIKYFQNTNRLFVLTNFKKLNLTVYTFFCMVYTEKPVYKYIRCSNLVCVRIRKLFNL